MITGCEDMKKYKFTGETKELNGITLKRIRALVDIDRFDVSAGDLGGWIEDDGNLDQCGAAWVSGDACVSGAARVSGAAWEKSPLYIQGSRYAFYMASANMYSWM